MATLSLIISLVALLLAVSSVLVNVSTIQSMKNFERKRRLL